MSVRDRAEGPSAGVEDLRVEWFSAQALESGRPCSDPGPKPQNLSEPRRAGHTRRGETMSVAEVTVRVASVLLRSL